MPSRRQLLYSGGAALGLGIAGFSVVSAGKPGFEVTLANYRDEPVPFSLTVRPDGRPDGDSVLDMSGKLPVMDGEADMLKLDDVAPAEPYRLELTYGSADRTETFSYDPSCTGRLEDGVGVLVDIYEEKVRFHQSECS